MCSRNSIPVRRSSVAEIIRGKKCQVFVATPRAEDLPFAPDLNVRVEKRRLPRMKTKPGKPEFFVTAFRAQTQALPVPGAVAAASALASIRFASLARRSSPFIR